MLYYKILFSYFILNYFMNKPFVSPCIYGANTKMNELVKLNCGRYAFFIARLLTISGVITGG